MVRKVVTPASTSVRTVVPCAARPKVRSRTFPFTLVPHPNWPELGAPRAPDQTPSAPVRRFDVVSTRQPRHGGGMDAGAFIAGLPKAGLHMHIEGSLEPELMFALARRNGVSIPYADVEAVRAAYSFSRLQDFLDIYYQGAAVLRTEADFHDLAGAYFDRAAADNVRHAEIFFDPQTHTARGLPFGVAVEGVLAGMAAAEAAHGITAKLILCFLRHLSEEEAF